MLILRPIRHFVAFLIGLSTSARVKPGNEAMFQGCSRLPGFVRHVESRLFIQYSVSPRAQSEEGEGLKRQPHQRA